VVAYALAGSMTIDIVNEPLGNGKDGKPVYLKDIWPSNDEIATAVGQSLTPEMFRRRYSNVFEGPAEWKNVKTAEGLTYRWEADSTYVKLPPLFEGISRTPPAMKDIKGARLLALLGDSITTDHISPAGDIKKSSPAGTYLIQHHVEPAEFNSYGARRGNHDVMMRGTFANIRIKNELMGGAEGGNTKYFPSGETMTIYDAAMRYQKENVPLVIVAGKEYGTGSSRDWAAKGTLLLGVRAVIAESFERIHRSNLVGMSVLPLVFKNGVTRADLKLTGMETFSVSGFAGGIKPRMDVTLTIARPDGKTDDVVLLCRIDTLDEVEYYKQGGILPYVLRDLLGKTA
jgi:aconitate hydratase